MVLIVDGDLDSLASAIKSEGASKVYWYADRTLLKEGLSVGLLSGNLLAKQQLSLEDALALWDDAVLYGAKPKKVASKKKAKEVVEEVVVDAEQSLD